MNHRILIEDTIIFLLENRKCCNVSEICRYVHGLKTQEETGLMARQSEGCMANSPERKGAQNNFSTKICQKCAAPRYLTVLKMLETMERKEKIVSVKTKHIDSNPNRTDMFRFYAVDHYTIASELLKDRVKRINYGYIKNLFR